jgi:WD40 repeat protein
MLGASSKCILASLGFDHEIRVWNLESRIIASQLIPTSQQHTLWPVATIAIDGKAEWLAICSKSGDVSFWNTRLQCFGRSTTIILDTRVVTCFFTSSPSHDGLHPATRLLLISASGCLTEIEVEIPNVISHQICANRVQSSHVNSHRRMSLRLITNSEDNNIYITAKRQDCWTSQAFDFSVPILNQPSRLRFTIIPDLRMVVLVWNIDTCQLYLIDLLSG